MRNRCWQDLAETLCGEELGGFAHRMLRFCVLLGVTLPSVSSWWFSNTTKPEEVGPWHTWLRESSPSIYEYVQIAEEKAERFSQEHYVELPQFDVGLWLVIDTLVGLVGWAVFGSAWNEVRLGCRRIFQFAALLGVCLAAHYVWAVCYPVVSIVIAALMTVAWCLRKVLKVMGTVFFYLQRWTGGAPEATGLVFLGPGSGKVPETTELRQMKRTGDAEKWIAVRRDGEVAVFAIGSEAQSIKSHGLYLPVEPDTVRGGATLVQLIRGVDKVHLCRNSVCPEECSAHFQLYAVVKQFNPESFQLAQAEDGAKEAGKRVWTWMLGTSKSAQRLAKKVTEYTSESEADIPAVCEAHRMGWTTDLGLERLSDAVCKQPADACKVMLAEDVPKGCSQISLCPVHQARYMTTRLPSKCVVHDCNRLGFLSPAGMHLCADHKEAPKTPVLKEKRMSSRSRSRSRARVQEPEDEVEDEDEDDEENGQANARRLLQEVGEAGHGGPARGRKRVPSRSPGNTPKSSVHRNLARIGLLDSPGSEEDHRALEEFFERLAEGKPMGVTEDEVRKRMKEHRLCTEEELLQRLITEAEIEQGKGQRGLSKFLTKWRKALLEERAPEIRADGWSLPSDVSRKTTPLTSPEGIPDFPPGLKKTIEPKGGDGVRIGAPGVYKDERKAGAGEGREGETEAPMVQIAKAIQHQTAELATLVRHQSEGTTQNPAGTLRGLGRSAEETVYVMRACGQYTVQVGEGEHGQALASSLLSAQAGASTKLREAGFRQKITNRLAIGIAGAYWGAHEKYTLTASDFVGYTDAELDEYAMESRNQKASSDSRPAAPVRFDDWMSRAKRAVDIWCLCYGEEWRHVKTTALDLLSEWHQAHPHRWPMEVVVNLWEELHWRFGIEVKELVRVLKKEAGRETMTLAEIKFYALLPGPDGRAWLVLPTTFDLERPGGWFQAEILPRIERKQERLLWNLTWQGGPKKERKVTQAGATDDRNGGGSEDKPTLRSLWGPKLTPEEVTRAKERAPLDRQGSLLCWGHLCHIGCTMTGCQRSHEGLRGSFESLDPCVRMQLLKRGGLKRMKIETKEGVNQKIKDLRAFMAKDKAEKTQDGKRRGERAGAESEGADQVREDSSKAGGHEEKRVRFWEAPEEFRVDYTKGEDLKSFVNGPDVAWGNDSYEPARTHPGRGGETAPLEAKRLVQEAQRLADGPVLSALEGASDNLYAWAAARVARDPEVSLEILLEEMAVYGVGELAREAGELLEEQGSTKAGEKARMYVRDTIWVDGEPGQGSVELEGHVWRNWDYGEELRMSDELAGLLQVAEAGVERRQCVTLALAAGAAWREKGRRPTLEEVQEKALGFRMEQTRQAVEALQVMGDPEEMVTAVEHELRIYCHDLVTAHHEKDFRATAAFPVEELQEARVVVLRGDYKGGLVIEMVEGSRCESGWCVFVLIWKGHMTLLQPPDELDVEALVEAEDPHRTPALGFNFFWHSRHDQARTAPGKILCRLCKGHRKAGEGDTSSLVRRHSCLSSMATLAGSGAQMREEHVYRTVRTRSSGVVVFREIFAGKADLTREWRRNGIAEEPIEVFEDPHERKGYRRDHDLTRLEVQKRLLSEAKDGDLGVGWVASPCTSYCDWQLQNGGSRTFENPVGTGQGPLAETEATGNVLSEFAAEYFETLLDAGGFPIAESSAPSGRYPKQWNLPCWQRILAREDVDQVEFPMCAFRLGPPDQPDHFYVHRTKVVFPRHEPLRRALSRACPGVGPNHKHTALKGCRPGTTVTRCTEAGAYARDFVTVVVASLQASLGGGLVSPPQERKCGGGRDDPGEEDGDEPFRSFAARVIGEASGSSGSRGVGVERPGPSSRTTPPRAVEAEGEEMREEVGTEDAEDTEDAENPEDAEQRRDEPVEGEASEERSRDQPEETSGEGMEESSRSGEGEEEELGEDDPTSSRSRSRSRGEPDPEAGARDDPSEDYWEFRPAQGCAVRHHVQRRKHLYVPQPEPDSPIVVDQFRPERRTQFWSSRASMVVIDDDWNQEGAVNPGYGWWVGTTAFTMKGRNLAWGPGGGYGWFGPPPADSGGDGARGHDDDDGEGLPPVVARGLPSGRDAGSGRAGGAGGDVQAPSAEAKWCAGRYADAVEEFDGGSKAWIKLTKIGNDLVKAAGSVRGAAESLWEVREDRGLANLAGVESAELDDILHPDMLAYMRDVRRQGMAARYVGERHRVTASLHPNAKKHVQQVFYQIAKDVKKHRVLLVTVDNPDLAGTYSSPFEAVDKLLPDRTLSKDKRVVHDQRGVNAGTSKYYHPPAVQPIHAQIARRILWTKLRNPGLPVLLAKKDIAGAFRLLWVAPSDVELFAGDLPWREEAFPEEEDVPLEIKGVTVIYLVSSFGFSGSPGEWGVWGRATEEYHRAHRPVVPRRDLRTGFDSKVLVDDNILVEPWVGLRPWVSSETFEEGVKLMLGEKAINSEKDEVEGKFQSSQTVWGIVMNAETEQAILPERRILKGAQLLSSPKFDYGRKDLTLKELQQFRGIMTGWSAVVKGLTNELRAGDRFLGGMDGKAVIKLSHQENYNKEQVATAWEDVWDLFEVCRWMSARSEVWAEVFGSGLREMLPPLEKVGLPGEWDKVVFVSSDATTTMVAAIDWKHGLVFREKVADLEPWIRRALEDEEHDGEEIVVHLAEMLSFVAFASAVAWRWRSAVVIYGGDNQVVKYWLQARKAGVRAGRILVRIVNMIEIRYGCVILAGWWRTYHNVDADYLTRCDDIEFQEFCKSRRFEAVEVKAPIQAALEDTERFGPCFLSWGQEEDRVGLQRLKEKRMLRQLQKELEVPWHAIHVCEWTAGGRKLRDFEEVAMSLGALDKRGEDTPTLGCATLGVDLRGSCLRKALRFFQEKGAWVGLVEGPRQVAWELGEEWCCQQGWHWALEEFVTTELGEALARRRCCLVVSRWGLPEGWQQAVVRVGVPVPMATILRKKEWNDQCWMKPVKMEICGGFPHQPLLPQVVGHAWWEEDAERKNLHGTAGPGRWPLLEAPGGPLQEVVVFDRRGPPGAVRRLTTEELWRLQGRTLQQLKEKVQARSDEELWVKEGSRATGIHTATSLLSVGGFLVTHHMEEQAKKAGMGRDDEGAEALAQLLQWLRRWRRNEYERAGDDCYAGGQVWRWAEAWWQEQLESEDENYYAGGRRRKTQEVLDSVAAKTVKLSSEVAPFCGEVKERVEEWLEEHMSGDKAAATEKAYASMWNKWKAWCSRQGWPSPFLNHKEDSLENENKVLGFMGYLGWLGSSSATLKQALFAIKDAHKKGGAGDPTSGMHRLWILTNAMDRQAVKRPRRLGVTPGMLIWIGKKMVEPLENEKSTPAWADSVVAVAALTTAWFFMLRAREFSDSGGVDEESVVRGCDLRFSKDGEIAEGGDANEVTLQFRKTKADQLAFGESKTLKATGRRFLCPVEALERMRLTWPGRFSGMNQEGKRPLFRWSSGTVLKRTEVQLLLQRAAQGVGLPPERFLSHSLRIGGATALYQATADIELVKRMGRWSSSTVQRYLHDGGSTIPRVSQQMAALETNVHYT